MLRPRFHRLVIADRREETRTCLSLAFDVPQDLKDDYRFRPGQYLTLRTRICGVEVRRSYSICSAPHESELRVAVKLLEGGVFSSWARDALRPGEAIEVMTPDGRFGAPPEPGSARSLLAIAAGSGITPIMSILKAALREERGRFFLLYGNRSTADIIFRGELEDLKDRHLGRLAVFHVLSREQQDLELLSGRLDAEKVELLLRRLVPVETVAHAFLCGPQPMIEGLAPALRDAGLLERQVHVERFTPGAAGPPPPLPPASAAPPARVLARASVVADGVRTDLDVAEGETILEAGTRAGLNLPYSCRGGMCCTCRARLVEGRAAMDVNYSLEPWEIEAGYVLTCQARPLTAFVSVDYDHF